MILQTFSIFDSKAEAFVQPFYSQTVGTAIRSFEQACNQADHDFNKFGGDYTLFHLGEFDQHTGRFTELQTPTNLGLAITHITAGNITTGNVEAIDGLREALQHGN